MRIRWTEPSVRDLTAICDYIRQHSGSEAARKIALRIYQDINLLARFPYLGRPGRKTDTHELIFTGLPFLAIYRIRKNDDVIEINRILHGAQRYP